MSSWTGEEVYEGLERWLKARRDESDKHLNPTQWNAVDALLNEVRDQGVEGWLPWQKLSE